MFYFSILFWKETVTPYSMHFNVGMCAWKPMWSLIIFPIFNAYYHFPPHSGICKTSSQLMKGFHITACSLFNNSHPSFPSGNVPNGIIKVDSCRSWDVSYSWKTRSWCRAAREGLTEGGLDFDDVRLLRVLTRADSINSLNAEDVLLASGEAMHHEPGKHESGAWRPGPALFPSATDTEIALNTPET